jgi:hypothetical protein
MPIPTPAQRAPRTWLDFARVRLPIGAVWLVCVTAFIWCLRLEASHPADDVRARLDRLHARWAQQVEQLALRYESQGETAGARSIRQILDQPETRGMSIRVLPPSGSNPDGRPATDNSEWQTALARLRKQHARELFELATAAFRAGDVSLCYDLVREVIENDPDHGPARNLMGFTKYRNDWVTQFAAGKLRAGFVWDDQHGWIPKVHRSHYENGEQLWKGQWLPSQEVAKYREQWVNAWEVETDHYVVRTNVSLERGAELAGRLEKLYAIFFRLFAGFFSPRDQMAVLLDPSNRRNATNRAPDNEHRAAKKFRVNYYRSRDEYLEALRPLVKSGLDASTGMYLIAPRTAYFYQSGNVDDSTVVHEATHQLFSETREHRNGEGSRGNYWVMEGIACYMESFREVDDRVELGSWETPRLKRGRQRLATFIPIKDLIELDRKEFDGPNIVVLYAESACLTHFLMHYDGGRYRDALVNYLETVYLGQADRETLSSLVHVDLETLEQQFREHVTRASEP